MYTWDDFELLVPGLKKWLDENLHEIAPNFKQPRLGDTLTIIFSSNVRIQVFFFFFF